MSVLRTARHVCLTLAIFASVGSVWAGDYSDSAIGTTSGKFLSFGANSRAAGMGEAYTSAPLGAEAVHYNPAAMSRIEGWSAEVMHANYLADAFFDYIGVAGNLKNGHALGLSALQISYGNISKTDETGYSLGTAHPSNLALTAAYSCKLDLPGSGLDGFAAGVSGRYVQSTIVSSAKTFTGGVGALSPEYGRLKLRFGLSAENLFGGLKYDTETGPLPTTIKLGGSLCIQPEWLATMDVITTRDHAAYLAAGTEKLIKTGDELTLAVRLGYNMRPAREIGTLAGFSTGLGISLNNFSIDYALTPFGDLGYTHKLGLGYKFGVSNYTPAPRTTRAPDPEPEADLPPTESLPSTAGESKKATVLQSQSVPSTKKSYQEYLEGADSLAANKEYKNAALEYGRAAATLPPDDSRRVHTYEQQGQMYLKGSNLGKAKEAFLGAIVTGKKLKASDKTLINSYLGLAYCFEKTGNSEAAIKNYEKALSMSPSQQTKTRIQGILRKLKTKSR